MKVSIMTRYLSVSREESICVEAIKCASKHKSNLLVFPGYHPSLPPPTTLLKLYEELSKKYNLFIIAEIKDTYLFTPEGLKKPFTQLFAKSSEKGVSHKVQMLYEEIVQGKRNFEIIEKKCRILLCGENNYLKNIRKDANKVVCRYRTAPWDWGYDILINPAHTSMKRWPELNKRFEYLSASGKTVLYTTNNNNTGWGTALRIYQNRSLLVEGNFQKVPSNTSIHTEETWRLITMSL